MNQVALIIIYNHRFDKNIAILEKIYKSRFSHIYHLVPFYDGDLPNVIAVYENSFYFEGYVAQGFKSFFNEKYTHYFFVADDMVLNPAINEANYQEHLLLDAESCFLPGIKTHPLENYRPTPIQFHQMSYFWPRAKEAYEYRIAKRGVEAVRELPPYEEALQRFAKLGYEVKPLRFHHIYGNLHDSYYPKLSTRLAKRAKYAYHAVSSGMRRLLGIEKYELTYPLLGGYADIFVVSGQTIRKFCHYCGVFAATDLFVEVALPTAMVLSAKKLVTEADIKLQGKALWTANEHAELDAYEFDFQKLTANFPANYLYLHPVKLSKWKNA